MTAIVVFISLAVGYGALKIILERRLAPLDAAGDEKDLADAAFAGGCSTYDLFRQAGGKWNFSDARIEADFRTYLNAGDIPGYVRLFLREQP
ncbi:MAG TPA: hypothetical protein VLT88_04250, partial [Desulfosarcina sp.]|nr:hypothetical protein [Desulfosarcina sp.]